MITFLGTSFVYGLIEYITHYLLHRFKNKRHRQHHLTLKSDNDYRKSLEKSIKMFIIPLIINNKIILYLYLHYVLYEFMHSHLHHVTNKNKLLHKLSRFHIFHHVFPNTNYGVTTPFGDYVFGTVYKSDTKKFKPSILMTMFPIFNYLNFILV
jgi:sterol desaturase/sphingolipid hydroxylase (fatty acid hydroxylase superfamily)